MRASMLLLTVIVALLALAGQAFAQGCGMSGMSGGGTGSCGAQHGGQAPMQSLPPAENMLQLTGTVVSIAPNGAALVDTGTAKLYVMSCPVAAAEGTTAPPPFKVGDKIQVAGILLALSVQTAPDATSSAAGMQQVTFKVSNILCGMCSAAVQQALQKAAGVKQVSVTTAGIAMVTFDPAVTSVEALARVIAGAKHPHGLKFKATRQ